MRYLLFAILILLLSCGTEKGDSESVQSKLIANDSTVNRLENKKTEYSYYSTPDFRDFIVEHYYSVDSIMLYTEDSMEKLMLDKNHAAGSLYTNRTSSFLIQDNIATYNSSDTLVDLVQVFSESRTYRSDDIKFYAMIFYGIGKEYIIIRGLFFDENEKEYYNPYFPTKLNLLSKENGVKTYKSEGLLVTLKEKSCEVVRQGKTYRYEEVSK